MVGKLKTTVIAASLWVLVVAASSAIGLTSTSVLGAKQAFPNGAGFGTVKPRHVFLGGDPTGNVTSVAWHNWGSQRSTGFGTGWCPGRSVASGHPCPVSLHVYALATCHRRRAYTKMAFYFKTRPSARWKLGSRWNICTGTVE
jgi:hypothetical protein